MQAKSSVRIVLSGALLILMACAALFASACGPNHEQAIRDALTDELDTIKNMDESFVSKLASDSSMTELEDFGIDPTEFVTAYLSGFDYRIDDVAVDGSNATATVVLTTKSFSEFSDSLNTALEGLLNDEATYSLSEEDLYAKVGQTVMDSINGLSVHENDPIQITYELIDNTWTPSAESQTLIENALLSN